MYLCLCEGVFASFVFVWSQPVLARGTNPRRFYWRRRGERSSRRWADGEAPRGRGMGLASPIPHRPQYVGATLDFGLVPPTASPVRRFRILAARRRVASRRRLRRFRGPDPHWAALLLALLAASRRRVDPQTDALWRRRRAARAWHPGLRRSDARRGRGVQPSGTWAATWSKGTSGRGAGSLDLAPDVLPNPNPSYFSIQCIATYQLLRYELMSHPNPNPVSVLLWWVTVSVLEIDVLVFLSQCPYMRYNLFPIK
jgi:hypothetical protein